MGGPSPTIPQLSSYENEALIRGHSMSAPVARWREEVAMRTAERRIKRHSLLVAGALLLLLTGCAGNRTTFLVPPGPGEKVVAMDATDFAFSPGVIEARKGELLVLHIVNRTGSAHNLTVVAPDGRKLVSLPLPPKATTEARLALTEEGIYPFYCDKPLHASFGMKGQIVVAAP